jgi:cation-transporting ATPase E
MKEAVFQGRRVVNNIQRSSSLFVMKDYLWFFITLLPMMIGLPHMIQPTVMSLVNIFITGIASLFVALEPDRTRVTGNFYKNVTKRAILSGFYMFIPVAICLLYVLFSQVIRTQTFDVKSLATVFDVDTHEIISIGWIPTMALCVTISGFIIFFKNCRPFTTFRKFLYIITLAVVLFILWLAPEFFIVSGTEMVNEVGGFLKIFPYIFSHIVPNLTLSLFKTMTLEQIIFVGVHALVAVPLYLLNEKFGGKLLDLTLFSKREYKDE